MSEHTPGPWLAGAGPGVPLRKQIQDLTDCCAHMEKSVAALLGAIFLSGTSAPESIVTSTLGLGRRAAEMKTALIQYRSTLIAKATATTTGEALPPSKDTLP